MFPTYEAGHVSYLVSAVRNDPDIVDFSLFTQLIEILPNSIVQAYLELLCEVTKEYVSLYFPEYISRS